MSVFRYIETNFLAIIMVGARRFSLRALSALQTDSDMYKIVGLSGCLSPLKLEWNCSGGCGEP